MNKLIITAMMLVASSGIYAKEFTDSTLCLAQNIYFEAANQPLAGRMAVAQVVMNRVADKKFPNSVCGVVYQARMFTNWKGNELPIRHKCQFSWYCDGKPDRTVDSKTWTNAINLAAHVILDNPKDITEGALYYHADWVHPYWADQLERVLQIKNHIFYK